MNVQYGVMNREERKRKALRHRWEYGTRDNISGIICIIYGAIYGNHTLDLRRFVVQRGLPQ